MVSATPKMCPLGKYVTRKVIVPPAVADDPTTNYNSHDEELVSRNRIVRKGQEGRAVKELENNKKQWWTPQAILDNILIRVRCALARHAKYVLGPHW